MIINAFERQQEIKELYQDDAYTILHIIHEKIFTVGYKKGPAQLWMTLSNQIYIVTYKHTQLTQASFLQKKSNVAKCFFDIF